MKKILVLLSIFILTIGLVGAADFEITANDVAPGTFETDDYFFPNNLYVGEGDGSDATAKLYVQATGSRHGVKAEAVNSAAVYGHVTAMNTPGVKADSDQGSGGYFATARDDGTDTIAGVRGVATGDSSGVYGESRGSGVGVLAESDGAKAFATYGDPQYGLYIPTTDYHGVHVAGGQTGYYARAVDTGLYLGTIYEDGIYIFDAERGLYVQDSEDYGIHVSSDRFGVYGYGDVNGGFFESDAGIALYAESENNHGIKGVSTENDAGSCGIVAENTHNTYGDTVEIGCKNKALITDGDITVGDCVGCDIAEAFLGNGLEPGDVVVLEPSQKQGIRKTTKPYDPLAVGIVSTDPTIVMGVKERVGDLDSIPIALSGVVPTKVVGSVEVGDLLTTSSVAGHAMACKDASRCYGATIGKAMESNTDGKGVVRALVMLS